MSDRFQLKALITGVDKLSPVLSGIRGKVAGFRKHLKSTGLGEFSIAGVVGAAAPLIFATKAAIDFESSMADVKKVVDFDSPEQFKAMGADILDMSKRLPMAAKDIAAIAAAGGQSGIAKSELPRFAEDAVKMGVAFDQTAEQAGDMMAKWRTSFSMGQDEVVALADKINYLGNTGPAKAKQISDIVTSIGPLGEVAGLASGSIAALGATIAGMGVGEDIAATGIKNFMLSLTAGSAATAAQKKTFKALRMDAKSVAAGMQKDAEGTMTRVLNAISNVDKSKQAAVMSELFGKESIGAIAPLLTKLDLLKENFGKVGDETKYAGSMNKEYEARAATTANNIQLFTNRATALGIAIGGFVLPPLNEFMGVVGPLVDGLADFAQANPMLIKGLAGMAIGFVALKAAVFATTIAVKVFMAVSKLDLVTLAISGLAMAAGFLIANWSTLGPKFQAIWTAITGYFSAAFDTIRPFLAWTPLGLIVANWGPLMNFFSELWMTIKVVAGLAFDGLAQLFLNFTPLGLIIKNWEPIVAWVSGWVERVKAFIRPLIDLLGSVGAGVNDSFSGALNAGADSLSRGRQSLVAQTTSAQQQKVAADMTVRFVDAPPGMRAEPGKATPGAAVNPQVGYRSLK